MDIILTSSPEAGHIAIEEIQAVDPGARLSRWLAPGVCGLELQVRWNLMADRLREQPPIFCRHVCPVQITLPLRQRPEDLDDLAAESRRFAPGLDLAQTFSVQTRLLGEGWPYTRYDVNMRLAAAFEEQGAALDVRRPQQIFSAVLTPAEGYLGLSHATDNLSDWAGGARRFQREEGQVSRAEFKLLEAMELFSLSLPAGGLALDLGAAPGGWTRILRQHDMRVVAVDPGELDGRIATDPAVKHMRQTAQNYLQRTAEQFDVILNDMRMDARDSAQVMVGAAGKLKEHGWGLLTLKLPQKGMEKVVAQALEVLRRGYRVAGARQLFHDRSEITVAVRRR